MRIAIDAPPVRSLSANEKMVYHLLKEGKTPKEIAKKMHLALGSVNDLKYNTHDVMPDTIVNLITSIRQKGWDIPTNNKEEAEMPRITLTEEDKRSIVTANQAGASVTELAAKYNIAKGTVYNIVSEFKKRGETALSGETEVDTEKEPATAATETGSEQEIVEAIPADIIPEKTEDVKPSHDFSPLAADAVWRKIEDLRKEAAELMDSEMAFEKIIADCKENIRCLDEQLIQVEAEIGILMDDYEAVTGGAAI